MNELQASMEKKPKKMGERRKDVADYYLDKYLLGMDLIDTDYRRTHHPESYLLALDEVKASADLKKT